jgi:GNAT superfamily N-acetyltransferase
MSEPTATAIKQIVDDDVDDQLDREIRDLLSACFIKPGDEVFRDRRYFTEMPSRRWLLRDEGRLVAHVAAHERTIEGGMRMLGIAEVCVLPTHRGRGLARALLATVHEWGGDAGFGFATLFGRPDIYASSGYQRCPEPVIVLEGGSKRVVRPPGDFLVRRLGVWHWPPHVVDLGGPVF